MKNAFVPMMLMLILVAPTYATMMSVTPSTPADNAWTTDSTPAFDFTAASDINATFSCELLVDGAGYGVNDPTDNNTATPVTPNASLAEGARVWEISCTDANGTVNSAQRTINIDATEPVPEISAPADGARLTNSPDITITITDNLDATIAYVLYVDGVVNDTGTVANDTPTDIELEFDQGTHTLILQGTDEAGNSENSSSLTFTISAEETAGTGRNRIPLLTASDTIILRSGSGRYAFLLERKVHYVRATSIIDDVVTLVFTSEPVELALRTGDVRNVDITGDSIVDVSVRIAKLTAKAVYLDIGLPRSEQPVQEKVQEIVGQVQETPTEQETISNTEVSVAAQPTVEQPAAQPTVEQPSESSDFWLILTGIAILGAAAWWFLR